MTIFNSTGGNPYTQIIFTHTLSSVALPLPLAPGCMVLFVKILSSALLLDLLGKNPSFSRITTVTEMQVLFQENVYVAILNLMEAKAADTLLDPCSEMRLG